MFKLSTCFSTFILASSLLLACKPEPPAEVRVPDGLLTEEQMVTLLSEFTLAESASGLNVANVKIEKFDSAYAFNPLKEHGVSKATFDSSLAFYSQHPEKMKVIYTKMLEQFSQMQAERKKK